MGQWIERRTAPLAAAAGLVASAVAGALTTTPRGPILLAGVVLVGLLGVLTLRAPAAMIALLVLAELDALPGLSLPSTARDLVMVLLLTLLGARALAQGAAVLQRPGARLALTWAVLFVGWWLVTWTRSVVLATRRPQCAARSAATPARRSSRRLRGMRAAAVTPRIGGGPAGRARRRSVSTRAGKTTTRFGAKPRASRSPRRASHHGDDVPATQHAQQQALEPR